jgi:hypothetical protein
LAVIGAESSPLVEPMLMDFNSWTANILEPIIYSAIHKLNGEILKQMPQKWSGLKEYYFSLSRVLTGVNFDLYLRDRQFEWFKKTAQLDFFKNCGIQLEVRAQFNEITAALI